MPRLPIAPRTLIRSGFRILVFSFLLLCVTAYSHSAWWTSYGVLDPQAQADDYAVANQGQAKHIASKARDYFNATLPGGAGTAINTLVNSWSPPGSQTDDFAALNIGQLKNLSKPFYDRLIAVQYTTVYPWSATTSDDESYALVNIGQVKNLFSFDLAFDGDVPPNGLPDWWERYYFNGQTGIDPNADADGDGDTNLEEFLSGTNPIVNDPPIITLLEPLNAIPQ